MVVIRFIESDIVLSINNEIACVNVVSFHDHIKYFWLMNSSFFHEVDGFILDHESMVTIVVQLNLEFVFQLTLFSQEILIFCWFSEILVVLC